MAERFAAAEWQTGLTGCPRLVDALVSFDCRINQIVSVGTHDILFCEVAAIVRHPEPRADVVRPRLPHAYASSLLTSNPISSWHFSIFLAGS
jgi:flavin reductase (DIM6/NTAB) family NADH-FMN oxidoreductase RutF